jgi:hypothetical protein
MTGGGKMNKANAPRLVNNRQLTMIPCRSLVRAGSGQKRKLRWWMAAALLALFALSGCSSDEDCLSCIELPPPVVPTGVHSISGNNEVIVQWYDIAYAPYDDSFNENVTTYFVYSRFYQSGDEFDPNREFFFIGEVAWDENYDAGSGLHWFVDVEAVNGEQYEYAVAAVNAAGRQSALSFEFVADAPLPMSPLDTQGWFIPVAVYDGNGVNANLSAFNFRQAGLNPTLPTAGVVAPNGNENIRITFENGIAYATANIASSRIQDFGVFTNGNGDLVFEGVSWAPADGYSRTGKLELVTGHVYVVEIVEPATQELHYAKFGIDTINSGSVAIIWAYQLIPGLPELKAVERTDRTQVRQQLLKL